MNSDWKSGSSSSERGLVGLAFILLFDPLCVLQQLHTTLLGGKRNECYFLMSNTLGEPMTEN